MVPGICPHCHQPQNLLDDIRFEEDFSLACSSCKKIMFAATTKQELYNVTPKGGFVHNNNRYTTPPPYTPPVNSNQPISPNQPYQNQPTGGYRTGVGGQKGQHVPHHVGGQGV